MVSDKFYKWLIGVQQRENEIGFLRLLNGPHRLNDESRSLPMTWEELYKVLWQEKIRNTSSQPPPKTPAKVDTIDSTQS